MSEKSRASSASKPILLRLPGREEDLSDSPRLDQIAVGSGRRFSLGTARDGGGISAAEVRTDDVSCLEFAGGFRLWLRVDELYEQFGVTSRGAADTDGTVWDINPAAHLGGTERGVTDIALKALEVFNVDLAGRSALEICDSHQRKKLFDGNKPGLYRCSLADAADQGVAMEFVGEAPAAAPDQPILVFIHGTGSSTRGGFGRLWDPANAAGKDARAALSAQYGEAVYGFEHYSLTQSPIRNALDLAKALPAGAELHLVSHSRGGLVGELLCLGQRGQSPDLFTDDFLDLLFREDRTTGEMLGLGKRDQSLETDPLHETYATQKVLFKDLLEELRQKDFRIGRFVRVACPAMGTTLASGRLDRWLSVLQFVGGQVGGPLVEEPLDFLVAVVQERTDPRTLPGLEAMMPGSALTRLLNHAGLSTAADLTVIAGDSNGSNLWGKLKLGLADWFYKGAHDLVVNTGSMYGGARRTDGRFALDQGAGVDHFHYFSNERTVRLLRNALTLPVPALKALRDFQPLTEAWADAPADRSARVRAAVAKSGQQGPRPVVFVLPGTMGSSLSKDNARIWLEYVGLSVGKLFELGSGARGVAPVGLLDDFYGDLVEYLARSHEVVAFPYDWRGSVADAGQLLARAVEAKLPQCEASRQPLRFIAHSMGGLVVRAMIAGSPKTWARVQVLKGSRFVMLGTPNFGSHEAVRWLTGWNPTLGKLALLDLAHDTGEIVKLVNCYQGLLELLPFRPNDRDFANPELWKALCSPVAGWPLPPADTLKAAAGTWDLVRRSPIDTERMLYVAGWAPNTVCDYVEPTSRGLFGGDRPPLKFLSTRQGDGTVTWDGGRLPGVKTWYLAEAAHDKLPSHQPAFQAYLELLQDGATARLPQTPPAASRAAAGLERTPLPPDMPERIPAERDLASFTFGGGSLDTVTEREATGAPVRVSLCHGHLGYARYPVCVGHYQGDTIVSAEADLDRRLDGALSQRMRLRLYPGALGTREVFIHKDHHTRPNGAIVVGLGRVGELRPGSLESGMTQALLDYAVAVAERPDEFGTPPGQYRSAGISALLIGTGAGGIAVKDSLDAILRAVKAANRRLAEADLAAKVRIDAVEFFELYLDRAIQAARDLASVLTDGDLADACRWEPRQIEERPGGLSRVSFEESTSWWHRTEIGYDERLGELRFIALTDRARAEESLVSGQMQLADGFIERAIASTDSADGIAKTLFEMLLPNGYKDLAPNQNDLVLIVDEVSARFPWELMQDRWGADGRPPVVSAGLLRQLKTNEFRVRPANPYEKTAYVVGNPLLPDGGVMGAYQFPDLPGAEKEAEAVAGLLFESGYTVSKAVRSDAGAILMGLHAERYRILHLSGHGVHEFPLPATGPRARCGSCEQDLPARDKKVSGLVIGNGIVLTPGDVEQMRWVPELVFINCCHLGRTDGDRQNSHWRPNRLAANLGAQFIRMGVRAVVAAGWAVDDAAAALFARTFYQHLIGLGETLGAATRAAREEIYLRYPGVNTWGAYQVYGDPAFRLVLDDPGPGASRGRRRQPYFDAIELRAELDNLANSIRMSSGREDLSATFDPWLESVLDRIPGDRREGWLRRADVAAALGGVYGELGRYREALGCLDAAGAENRADISVRHLEQRANFRIRSALEAWLANPAATDPADIVETRAIPEINWLCRSLGETEERLSLLGGAYKRLAWMRNGGKKKELAEALEKMADAYRRAFEASYDREAKTGTVKTYPLTNWLTGAILLAWFRDSARAELQELEPEFRRLCAIAVAAAEERNETDPDFWNSLAEADCLLMLELLDATLAPESPRRNAVLRNGARIAEAMQRAFVRGGSRKDKASTLEHIEFLAVVAARNKGHSSLVRELRELSGAFE